jgi:hypothetical protein
MKKLPAWVWIVAFWCAIGLFDATRTVFVMRAEGMHHNWPHLFLVQLLSWVIWALATPLALRLDNLRAWKGWLVHPAVCLGIGIAAAGWLAWLEEMLNPWAGDPMPDLPATTMPDLPTLWQIRFEENLLAYAVLYGTALMIGYALRARQQIARQRELLANAQLDALRRQIEPHFLFNSLNAIVSLIREQRSSDAIAVTVELSDLLRRVLDDQRRSLVPLSEEVDFLSKYLDIQKIRFGDRLGFAIERPADLEAEVPALILQPLAENALKHGIGRRAQGGLIDIRVERFGDRLTICVENDGPPLPAARKDGIGLSNVRARLDNLYGGDASLSIYDGAPGKVLVTLSLPYRPA